MDFTFPSPVFDMIVVGAGPAGLALAARLAQQGFSTLIIGEKRPWPHTLGVWEDELPSWFPRTGITCVPEVWLPGSGSPRRISLRRTYRILDNQETFTQLAKTPGLHWLELSRNERAHFVSNLHVKVGISSFYARTSVFAAIGVIAAAPDLVQLAWGGFKQDENEPAVWMDFSDPQLAAHGGFWYRLPTPNGFLQQATLAVAQPDQRKWLDEYAQNQLAEAVSQIEAVAFTMNPAAARRQQLPRGVVPLGTAAGLMHPLTGYSVGTSLRLCDEIISAVIKGTRLPHRRLLFRVDLGLLWSLQPTMLAAGAATIIPQLLARPELLPGFLELGNLPGTLKGMWAVFQQLNWQEKLQVASCCSLSMLRLFFTQARDNIYRYQRNRGQ